MNKKNKMLMYSTTADNISVGLELYRKNKIDDRIRIMLERGLEIFKLLQIPFTFLIKRNTGKYIFSDNEIKAYELYELLGFLNKKEDFKGKKDISDKARQYRRIIEDLIYKNIEIEKEKIEEIQDFSDNIESYFLQKVGELNFK